MRNTQLWKRHGVVGVLSVLLFIGLLVCSVLGIISSSGTALATPASGQSTSFTLGHFDEIDVKSHTFDHQVRIKTKGLSDVYFVTNTFVPGGHSGWHTHPGPSLITVKSGTVTAYDGDDPTCTPLVYTAGSGFIDPGDGHVHLLRNEGSVDAVTVVVQFLPPGADRRIDAPNPGNCPF
jgi:quercetin dioxygenase-like cupin family protein